jgi:tetratricopeptide (TPR) repeat protein
VNAARVTVAFSLLWSVGCTPGTVTRVVDGEAREGRAVGEGAYAAYAKAELSAAQGDRKQALSLLSAALDQDPDSPEILTRYGEILCADNAGTQALERFEKALEFDPAYAPAFLGRARCLRRLGRANEALVAAERAAYLDPMALDTTREVSELLFARARAPEAWRWLEARILLEPTSRAVHALLLEAALRERDDERAERARRVLAVENERSKQNKSEVTLRSLPAEPRHALSRAERRLAADPDDTDAWVAALVSADLLGESERFEVLLGALSETPLPISAAALELLVELVARRCGPNAAAALSLAARPDLR